MPAKIVISEKLKKIEEILTGDSFLFESQRISKDRVKFYFAGELMLSLRECPETELRPEHLDVEYALDIDAALMFLLSSVFFSSYPYVALVNCFFYSQRRSTLFFGQKAKEVQEDDELIRLLHKNM